MMENMSEKLKARQSSSAWEHFGEADDWAKVDDDDDDVRKVLLGYYLRENI